MAHSGDSPAARRPDHPHPPLAGDDRSAAKGLNAKLILGIDLEADSLPLAAAEAREFTANLDGIEALEPGNEPELYPTFGWYRTRADQEVPGRPRTYDFQAFTHDFTSFAQALRTPLAGPATGSARWMRNVPSFIAEEPRLSLLTLHRYPLQQCFTPADAPTYPTDQNLLREAASEGLADSVAPYATLAHAHRLTLRIDEMNTISCGESRVGHSQATALWAADALFAMAQAGVDGVNIHTYPGATYDLFSFTHRNQTWTATVEPEYYGLLMFARAAPAGARLLPVTDPDAPTLRVWATKAPDGQVRVLLLNDSLIRPQTVAIRGASHAPDVTTLAPASATLLTFG